MKTWGEVLRIFFGVMPLCAMVWFSNVIVPAKLSDLGGRPVVVIGSMGSGTVAMNRGLRRLGLDVDHEATIGVDGVVGWIHALLYFDKPTESLDPLCLGPLSNAWHLQLIAVDKRDQCGGGDDVTSASEACWKRVCPGTLAKWRGCASRQDCPTMRFAENPVVLVRHPLRTVESLIAGFCTTKETPPQLIAAARLLPQGFGFDEDQLATMTCGHAFAAYWYAFHSALRATTNSTTWLRREATTECDVVTTLLNTENSAMTWDAKRRLETAAGLCSSSPLYAAKFRLRETFAEYMRGEELGNNAKNTKLPESERTKLTWADLQSFDPTLHDNIAKLAKDLGFPDDEEEAAICEESPSTCS